MKLIKIGKHALASVLLIVFALSCNCAEKQRKSVNVKDFGAKGNGIADDTQGIMAAFKQVLSTGGTVYFPAGQYLSNVIDIKAHPGVKISVTGDRGKSVVKKRKEDPVNVALFFCEVKDVSLDFSNLTLKGTLLEKNGYWIHKDKNRIDVDKGVNGIYGYNLKALTVKNCVVTDFHGKGIAAFNTQRFIATNNSLNNTSGSAIMGHRVDSMYAQSNTISNTASIGKTYYLDGKLTNRSEVFPLTIFGDGIEGDCNHLIATNNIITNPGRCGIVHDLAKNLGYQSSSAKIANNQIIINSASINNGNPPAGMWFEQSHDVEVKNNQIVISKSTSQIVSGIRFYEITGRIVCNNNLITANRYNLTVGNGIGVFEPETDNVEIKGNQVVGKYDAGISVSYGGQRAKLSKIDIGNNLISGKGVKNGIEIAVASSKSLPSLSIVKQNNFIGINGEVIKMYYYGGEHRSADATRLQWNNNKVNGRVYQLKVAMPKGLKLEQ